MAAMAAAAAAALRRPHHLRVALRGACRPFGSGGGGEGGGGRGTTLNLTDLERRAAWKARWMKDDPTADVNSVMFEDDAGSEQIPDDLSFGYFENSLKWEIYKKHKEDPEKYNIVRLSNEYELSRDRIEAIIRQKELVEQDQAKGVEIKDFDAELQYATEQWRSEMSQYYGVVLEPKYKEAREGKKIHKFEVLSDYDKEDRFSEQPPEVQKEFAEAYEKRLGMKRLKRIEMREAAKEILKAQIEKAAVVPSRKRSFIIRDTSLKHSASVVREKDGTIRLATVEEDQSTSWRHEL